MLGAAVAAYMRDLSAVRCSCMFALTARGGSDTSGVRAACQWCSKDLAPDVEAAGRPRRSSTGAVIDLKGGKQPVGDAARQLQHQGKAAIPPNRN